MLHHHSNMIEKVEYCKSLHKAKITLLILSLKKEKIFTKHQKKNYCLGMDNDDQW